MDITLYPRFAPLLRYPRADLDAALDAALAAFEAAGAAEASQALGRAATALRALDASAREELFLKTFELQAICCLEVGYTRFGEDYKRGMFLAGLKDEHRRAGHDCGDELADHLANVLELLPSLDAEVCAELAEQVLIPALRAMLDDFDEPRLRARLDALAARGELVLQEALHFGNPYGELLRALALRLEADWPGVPQRRSGRASENFIPIHDRAAAAELGA
jgi:nitrate reductase assembly molybdenum cofactor insertion protein NarJ